MNAIALALAVLLAAPPPSELPSYRAADPAAGAVTSDNLLASERFWPYLVGLTRPFERAGSKDALEAGLSGVLIRVEPGGVARIDFGRDGVHDVPVAATDLVELANRVRLGELEKDLPNFVLAVGPRALDSASSPPRPLDLGKALAQRGFLCVYADPAAESFAALVRSLAPLRERRGLMTFFFPQRDHADLEVGETLRSLGWTVPYVYDHLSESYTRSLIDDPDALPTVVLQTSEGRVLYESRWTPTTLAELNSVVDSAFPPPGP